MLDKIKEIALEKFAGDQTLADEFIKGFSKQAIFGNIRDLGDPSAKGFKENLDLLAKHREYTNKSFGGTAVTGMMKALGEGMGGLAITTTAAALGRAVLSMNNDKLRSKYLTAFEHVLETNRIVGDEARKSDKDLALVKSYAETIFGFAPNIAADPNLLSTLLANAVHGQSIDPMTIKTITDLERTYKDNTTFTPKSYI